MTALLLRLFARADRWVTRYVAKPARSVSPVNTAPDLMLALLDVGSAVEHVGTYPCCWCCWKYFGGAGCGSVHRDACDNLDCGQLGDTGEITVRGAVVITALWIAFAWAMTALGTAWTGVQ